MCPRLSANYVSCCPPNMAQVSVWAGNLQGIQKKDYFHISYIGYFIITLMSILLSGRTYAHYAMVLIPVMIYPMAQIINKVNWRIPAQLCATIYTIFSICVPCWLIGTDKVVEAYLSRKLQQTRTDIISQVVDLIIENTDADSRITVWGNACNYYILSRRLSASKYIYQSPIGDVNPMIYDEYFRELEKKKPEIKFPVSFLFKITYLLFWLVPSWFASFDVTFD